MCDADEKSDSATTARLTEAGLALGARLDGFSLALTILAIAALIFERSAGLVQAGMLCVVVLGVLEKYFALRVALDQKLFSSWADHWATHLEAKPGEDMARLDKALVLAGMKKQTEQIQRNLSERQRGAFSLLRCQGYALVLQLLVLLASALAGQQSL